MVFAVESFLFSFMFVRVLLDQAYVAEIFFAAESIIILTCTFCS